MCSRRHPSKRSGFTLLEVLLALALGVLLLSAVYSAIELHWKTADTGQIDMQRSQVARALLNQMAIDIRSVIFTEPDEYATNDDEDEDSETEGDSEDETVVEVIDPTVAYTESSVGVFGDSQTLVLHISKPIKDASYEAGSDLRSVSYFLAGSGSGTLQELASIKAVEDDEDSSGTGLARMEGDRLSMQFSDAEGDVESMVEQTQLLAEEVAGLSFEYFDGFDWLDAWDSLEMAALPTAIRVTIEFHPVENEPDSFLQKYASYSTNQFSLVVALPLAKPYAGDLEL